MVMSGCGGLLPPRALEAVFGRLGLALFGRLGRLAGDRLPVDGLRFRTGLSARAGVRTAWFEYRAAAPTVSTIPAFSFSLAALVSTADVGS